MKPATLPAAAAVLLVALTHTRAAEARLEIDAGPHDRRDSLVEFQLPATARDVRIATDDSGASLPVQVQPDGMASLRLPALAKGSRKSFRLLPLKAKAEESVRVTRHADTLRAEANGLHAFTYQAHNGRLPPDRPDLTPAFTRGGYIHPVLTPAGRLVTDDYPPNHRHHHGIWYAWTKTTFEGRSPDFWNMGDRKGTVEFVEVDRTWNGPVHGGFESRHRQVDLTSGTRRIALEETWSVRLLPVTELAGKPAFVFDIVVTDSCATDAPLVLPKYRYGGIGVRGHRAWDGATNLNFLSSEGLTDRSKGDNAATRGRWAHLGGQVEGAPAGIAILSHPANPFPPQPQRIHPTEPFLCLAPQQAGDLSIAPGKPLTQRYRFVVSDGPPSAKELDRLWSDYAEPPAARVLP